MITFESWGKTPRLTADDCCITEKIHGTNACVVIFPFEPVVLYGHDHLPWESRDFNGFAFVEHQNRWYIVGAQSRNKLIFPGKATDNAGFAGWVQQNASELVDLLGPGRHFGEWWGLGIQHGYNLGHKVFSLFNTHRWTKVAEQREDWEERARAIQMDTVPVLYQGPFSDVAIEASLDELRREGSVAARLWGSECDQPEGVIIRHRHLGGNLKAFVDGNVTPKSQQVNGTKIRDITFYDGNTMYKVHNALGAAGFDVNQCDDAITEMQNAGILFRESE